MNYFENREKKEKHEKAGQYGNLTKLDSTPSSTSFCNDRFNDTSHCVETNNAPKNNLRNFFKIGAIGALIIAFVIGMVFLLTPKSVEGTISGFEWGRSISVEEYRTVDESDWVLPSGGRLKYSQQEIRSYQQAGSYC